MPPEDTRIFQSYLRELQAFATPEEVRDVLREVGTIRDWRERNAVLEEIIFERKARAAAWKTIRVILAWLTATLVAVGAIRALLPPGIWPW